MTDKPDMPVTDIAAAETTPTLPAVPAAPPMAIEISLPADWSYLHWQTYTNAAQLYNADVYDHDGIPNPYLAKYHGSLALIKADLVHVTGVPELADYVNRTNHDSDKMQIIDLIAKSIGNVIEASVNRPLEISLSALYGTTVTVSVTRNQAP